MQHGLEINLVFYQENRTNSGSQVRSCLVEDAMAAAGHPINKDIPLSGTLEQHPPQISTIKHLRLYLHLTGILLSHSSRVESTAAISYVKQFVFKLGGVLFDSVFYKKLYHLV